MLVDGHQILSVGWEAGEVGDPGTRVMGEEPRRGDDPVTRVRGPQGAIASGLAV
jgi:hypothetical protein